jgi:phage/plasmid-associated DNA primase
MARRMRKKAPAANVKQPVLHRDDGDQPDAIDVLGEWFGYVISGRTDLHKILLMVGPTSRRCVRHW